MKTPVKLPLIAAFRRCADSAVRLLCIIAVPLLFSMCSGKSETPAPSPPANAASEISAAEIVEKYRATDNSRNSTIKSRARITEADGSTHDVQMTVYRKRDADKSLTILVQLETADERDRSGLISINPQGDIEGVRYVQSNNSFLTSKDVAAEDGLFKMTLQELADGQPEKYDFKLLGKETVGAMPAYRLEGKLKAGAESKFPRIATLVSQENFTLLGVDFYDTQDQLARRITMDKIEKVDGYWTRVRWTVDNQASKKKIVFETLNVKYDQNLSDALFSKDNLKKIASR